LKVVILCGGRGSRLNEETGLRPKPLVEIGGRPILWHIMKLYAHHGFKDFVLCLGYKGDMIKSYFLNYHCLNSDLTVELSYPPRLEFHRSPSEEGWRVTLADTGLEAMTGARLKRVERYVDGDTFMLTYGDGVADIDLQELVAFHRSHGRLATVTGVRPPARFGELVVEDGMALEFREKPQVRTGRISGGFFVLDRRVFDYVEADDSCNFERGPLATLAREHQLMVYPHDGFWQCMDTYRDWMLLNEMWEKQGAPWKVW
jgi:glucose-1-phosphate cytidylyltransferase